MKMISFSLVLLTFTFLGNLAVVAVPKKTTFDVILAKLDEQNLHDSLSAIIKNRTALPRYFESECDPSLKTDNPLYPNIPYKECTYKEGGLNGWVQLAVIPPDMLTSWIANACKMSENRRKCVALVAAYVWDSNQFSFPIAGNIIEGGRSAGASDDSYLNLIFLHGVTIPLPEGVPQRQSVAISTQRIIFGSLARRKTVELPAQVSRPAGIRREIYLKYAEIMKADDGGNIDVGASCPLSARKAGWLEVSRRSLVEAWDKPDHRLFSALAKALEKGAVPGRIPCGKS